MSPQLYSVITALACAGTFWSCFCRIYAMNHAYRREERAKYVAMMGGALAFGLQGPLFSQVASGVDTLFACIVFGYMLLGMWRWKHGAPADAITDNGVLDELEERGRT